MRNVFLGMAVCLGSIAPFIVAPPPAHANGPFVLKPGEEHVFPTWHAGKSTKFCVSQKNTNASAGTVYIQPRHNLAHEIISVAPGATSCVDRYWAGVYLGVSNTGKTYVSVWTE